MRYEDLTSHIAFCVTELPVSNEHRFQGEVRYHSELAIPNEDLDGFKALDNAQDFVVRSIVDKMSMDLDVDLDKYDLVRNIPFINLFDMVGRYRSGALCDSFGRPLYPDHRCLEVSYEDESETENS